MKNTKQPLPRCPTGLLCAALPPLQGSLLVHADCVMGHMEPAQPASAAAAVPRNGPRPAGGSSNSSGRYSKVHNGVAHGATEAGAFGGRAMPAGSAAPRLEPVAAQQQAGGEEQRLLYSDRCGRVRFTNVRVQNRGVDWAHPGNVYWRHKVRYLDGWVGKEGLRGGSGHRRA